MNKSVLIFLGLVAFCASADPQVEANLAYVTELIGDTTGFPEWFQAVVDKKFEIVRERFSGPNNKGPMPSPPGPDCLLGMEKKDLEGIDDLPDWYDDFQTYIHDLEMSKMKQKLGDFAGCGTVPNWFKDWYAAYKHNVVKYRFEEWH